MTPRSNDTETQDSKPAESCFSKDHNLIGEATRVYHTPDGAPYVICQSHKTFVNPTTPLDRDNAPEAINATLNLDLGQKFLTRKESTLSTLFAILYVLDWIFFRWWESVFFYVWSTLVPVSVRRAFIHQGWSLFLAVHKATLGKRTGIHPSLSYGAHAMTTMAWMFGFVCVTPNRVHFSLSQFHTWSALLPPPDDRMEQVLASQEDFWTPSVEVRSTPLDPKFADSKVNGIYVYHNQSGAPKLESSFPPSRSTTSNVIFWIYGGAFLGGDAYGNSASAERVSKDCGMDVFIPNFRRALIAKMDELQWDICLAYNWLDQHLKKQEKQDGKKRKIYLMGISSGAGLAIRLMQMIQEQKRGETNEFPAVFSELVRDVTEPSGAVFLGAYIDYDPYIDGSFLHYTHHDLVVNHAVRRLALQYILDGLPDLPGIERRKKPQQYSPVQKSMEGLPPLLVVVSEHEAVYDMSVALVNNARRDGVQTTFCVFKYLCHVFTLFEVFLPEGKLSLDQVGAWLLEQANNR